MTIGFKSSLPILGLSSVPSTTIVGRGNGPLPFLTGSRVAESETVGRGNGPLPFLIGSKVVVSDTIGRGNGPHPLLLGVGEYVEPVEPVVPVKEAGGSYGMVRSLQIDLDTSTEDLRKLLKDDEDLIEIMSIVLSSGVLD